MRINNIIPTGNIPRKPKEVNFKNAKPIMMADYVNEGEEIEKALNKAGYRRPLYRKLGE